MDLTPGMEGGTRAGLRDGLDSEVGVLEDCGLPFKFSPGNDDFEGVSSDMRVANKRAVERSRLCNTLTSRTRDTGTAARSAQLGGAITYVYA